MTTFYKFPSIENGRYIVDKVVEKFIPEGADSCEVVASVKIHGTCSAIVKHAEDGPITFQSRSRILTADDDNAAFFSTMAKNMKAVHSMFHDIESAAITLAWPIIVYGEWCGKGIQKNVAVNEIEKTFVIFKILDGKGAWIDTALCKNVQAPPLIRNLSEIPSYSFVLRKDELQADLDKITEAVDQIDQQCPFAFQLFGISGHGEGLVLRPKASTDPEFWWKVKGESHQRTRPPSVQTDVKPQFEKEHAFAARHVTYERVESAKEAIGVKCDDRSLMKHFGQLSKWMISDIEREETFAGLERQATTRAITSRFKELLLK